MPEKTNERKSKPTLAFGCESWATAEKHRKTQEKLDSWEKMNEKLWEDKRRIEVYRNERTWYQLE